MLAVSVGERVSQGVASKTHALAEALTYRHGQIKRLTVIND